MAGTYAEAAAAPKPAAAAASAKLVAASIVELTKSCSSWGVGTPKGPAVCGKFGKAGKTGNCGKLEAVLLARPVDLAGEGRLGGNNGVLTCDQCLLLDLADAAGAGLLVFAADAWGTCRFVVVLGMDSSGIAWVLFEPRQGSAGTACTAGTAWSAGAVSSAGTACTAGVESAAWSPAKASAAATAGSVDSASGSAGTA